ncbi:SURF1 family protein [Ancylobacter sp. 6x-1]|uniref:SURF1-like protein n=1 Tax=Ancylobacter crimeensis TaxID=2579147 RepID=A0ABT0D912_9HYPH|nr:SURF1 family protein [Ancylobacter crimeensis]MCK0196438.1 SURF1 family protein [Ancylobacter crimeensis]
MLRSLLGPGIATLLLFPILVGLGWWQLDRLRWKEDLIAKVEARIHEPAVPVPAESAWGGVTFQNDEYRRVTATGHFRNDLEVQAYALVDETPDGGGGPGYWVVTPLVMSDGTAILVNRGFVPLERKAASSRPQGDVEGPVAVTGLLRMPETATLFTPDNDPARDAWYTRDPKAIAAVRGLSRVAPFLIDADATPNPGGLPVGGLTRITFPNRHMEYALTWFGLAATLLVFFAVFAMMRLRERS